MLRYYYSLVMLILIFLGSCSEKINSEFNTVNLRCEYMKEAVVAKPFPRFSWEISSTQGNQKQSAWQVIVSDDKAQIDTGQGNVWDSGKTRGSETFNIKWQDVELQPFTIYYWKVRVWDRDGKVSSWGEPARFITGAFNKKDWNAGWIGDQPEEPLEYPLRYKHIGYLSAYADQSDDEKWVQMDLGETREFDRIKIYPSHNNKREIIDYYFPLAYRIEVSDDAKDWKALVIVQNAPPPGGKSVEHVLNETKARYIRFTATKLKQYDHINYNPEDRHNQTKKYAFSLAELELVNDNRIVSQGSQITFKDALVKIDRENGYDPDMLADGITDTPPPPKRRPIPPSPLLRKTIDLKEKPVQALAYVSALGLYEIAFNKQSADNRVLAPEWTDYNKRVQYQVFDVSHMLDVGTNVIGAQLADGWYAGMLGPVRWSPYFPKRGGYGLDRRLFFQMEVVYPNGEKEIFSVASNFIQTS